MRLFQLNKIVLNFQNNAEKFLSGLTTNTLDRPKNAFVTVHGRIVATFDQIKISDDEYWAVMENSAHAPLLKHLENFLRLNKTEVKLLEKKVYFDLECDCPFVPGDYSISQNRGKLLITERHLTPNVSEEEFTLFRLGNNIPLQGVDYTDQLLLNVNDEDYVSYTKGCFLGQEPIAKVHNRSQPTWKLAVRFEDELTDEEKSKMTSKIPDPPTGRVLGFVFVKNS